MFLTPAKYLANYFNIVNQLCNFTSFACFVCLFNTHYGQGGLSKVFSLGSWPSKCQKSSLVYYYDTEPVTCAKFEQNRFYNVGVVVERH